MRTLRRALAIREALYRSDPKSADYRRSLRSYNILGYRAAGDGRNEEALRDFGRSIALREALVREYPHDTTYQGEVAQSLDNIAGSHEELGHRAEAAKAYRRSIAIREALARENPAVAEFRETSALGPPQLLRLPRR